MPAYTALTPEYVPTASVAAVSQLSPVVSATEQSGVVVAVAKLSVPFPASGNPDADNVARVPKSIVFDETPVTVIEKLVDALSTVSERVLLAVDPRKSVVPEYFALIPE